MHMTQSPILIALILQRFERTGRVVRMFRDASKICVQDPNVKETRNRCWILSSQILGSRGSGKTLTVYRYSQFVIRKRLWLTGTKNMDVAGRPELLD